MSKYLKLFENHTQYETFIGGGGVTPFIRPNVSYCTEENEVHYSPLPHDYSKDYLTFLALEDGTFTFAPSGGNVISYSIDNGDNWSVGNSVELTKDNKVLWRGKMTPTSGNGVGTFSSTGRFEAQGNVMSLLFGDEFKGKTDLTGKNYAFYGLFSSNSKLVNAQNISLPATTLASWCYSNMFNGCTSLVNAPELPATTLSYQCYRYMFDGCTSLVNAPELPATELSYQCYRYMFDGCTKLNYIKAMFTTTPGTDYTYNWVSGVASSGTFVKNSAATWNVTGVDGIPSGWTVETATE